MDGVQSGSADELSIYTSLTFRNLRALSEPAIYLANWCAKRWGKDFTSTRIKTGSLLLKHLHVSVRTARG